MMRVLMVLVALLAIGLGPTRDARAEWPDRPIRMIVPFAVVLPAGVPADIVARLSATMLAVVNSPDVQQNLKVQGVDPEPGAADLVAARIRDDIVKWRSVVEGAKITGAR
jgi:tripartite-type tricarboxylate transporter receptor subunit TctC